MTILHPIFGRGVAQRQLGAEVPELHQKLTVLFFFLEDPWSRKSRSCIVWSAISPPFWREKGGKKVDKRWKKGGVYIYDGMARKTGYLEIILPDIAKTPNFQAMLRVDKSHSIRKKKSLRAF